MADGFVQPERSALVDTFGRQVTYLRLSVTDRCDLRCSYCMPERMTFLPKPELLTLEELELIAKAFIRRGVRKVRLTGGEPLVRKGILTLVRNLGKQLGQGLDELTLTTNGTLLPQHATSLKEAGVKRVNVSLDSLDPIRFHDITRRGELSVVLAGIDAARAAGLTVKINTVALKNQNAAEIPALIEWAHRRGMDLTLIEVMPLGETGEARHDQYVPLPQIVEQLSERWTLTSDHILTSTSGPARYFRIEETGGRLGLITPLTNNFCAGCNRMRVTATGRIYMCLGQDDHIDLRQALRASADPERALEACLDRAVRRKPERHDFNIAGQGSASDLHRHMSETGG